ncbi:MAG: dihydrolipoyl dehydrogenase, partial [Deltaproteobacteria bacterium]|nr:dihydrolipoyl dehydrogenase [Deltaproteobacteria bacterium]
EHAKHKLGQHGVIAADIKLDLTTMMKRKDKVVEGNNSGIAFLFKKNKVTWVQGFGKLTSATTVEVKSADGTTQTLTTKNVILATGSVPAQLPTAPYDGKRIIDSTGALSLPEVPKTLLVLGGGAIGLEMGSVWSRLGSKVTVVEFMDRIVPFSDKQMGTQLLRSLTKQGLEFKLSTKVTGAKTEGKKVIAEVETADGKKEKLEADYMLVSIGRKPYSEGLGLKELGIAQDKQGRVDIDGHFQTSVKGVYAIGDLVKGPMLAHKAEDEGMACAEIIAGKAGHVNYDAIPNVVYTWPELATVGLSEEELQAKGIAYNAGSFPFLANGRAKAMAEADGLVKILADAKTDRVLGVHILGPRASDMIAEAVMVMEFHGAAEDIALSCHPHPTLTEAVREAALAVAKRAIHI